MSQQTERESKVLLQFLDIPPEPCVLTAEAPSGPEVVHVPVENRIFRVPEHVNLGADRYPNGVPHMKAFPTFAAKYLCSTDPWRLPRGVGYAIRVGRRGRKHVAAVSWKNRSKA